MGEQRDSRPRRARCPACHLTWGPHEGGRMRLDGKIALVTGGTGVIGNAIATRLAEAGADVIIVARRIGPLTEAAEAMAHRTGRTVVPLAGDVGDPDAVTQVVTRAETQLGGVDVLVNNTFVSGGERPIVELDVEDWDAPWRVNVMGPFLLAKGCVPMMQARGGGSIVNVLTTAAFLPLSPMAPYGVTKSALWTLTRYLAKECAPA